MRIRYTWSYILLALVMNMHGANLGASSATSEISLDNGIVHAQGFYSAHTLNLESFAKTNETNLLASRAHEIFVLHDSVDQTKYTALSHWDRLAVKQSSTELHAHFQMQQPRRIEVQIRMTLKEQRFELQMISVDCATCDHSKLEFPRISFGLIAGGLLHVPEMSGVLHPMPERDQHQVLVFDYPSSQASYQMFGAISAEKGLYLAHHDPSGSKKVTVLDKLPGADSVIFKTFWRTAEPQTPAGVFVLASEPGTWREHAKLYQSWASGPDPVWNQTGNVTDRPIDKIDFWVVSACPPQTCLEQLREIRQQVSGRIGFHWYDWHQNAFDTEYPRFFPARQGFKQVIKELQELNIAVIPYINGQIWDNAVASDYPGCFENSVYRQNGQPAIFTINHRDHSSGCPVTPWWQDTVKDLVRRLVSEYGADGVYFDSVAAGYATCFASHHDHPPGGGSRFWERGYYKILADLKAELGPNTIFVTEGNSEPYVGHFDGFLTWNFMRSRQQPIFAFLYGTQTRLFGRFHDHSLGSRDNAIKALRMKAGQALVFGEQLGWFYPKEMKTAEYQYLNKLVNYRLQYNKFFNGTQLQPPTITSPMTKISANWWTMWTSTPVTLDAIQVGAFQADNERRAFFINLDDKPHTFRFTNSTKTSGQTTMTLGAGEIGSVSL